jgi:antitoxin CcdA
MISFEGAPKKATNLTLNARVLEVAREMGINVSQVVDTLLQEEVRRLYREKWLVDNQDAITEYNERVRREGVFSDGLRSF